MKRAILAIAMVLVAVPAMAQTQVVGTERVGWDQPAATLAAAQGYAYEYVDGSAPSVPLSGVACSGTASPFVCAVRLPALTTGIHSVRVVASVTVNGTTLTSPQSAPLSLLMMAVPATPQNLRLLP